MSNQEQSEIKAPRRMRVKNDGGPGYTTTITGQILNPLEGDWLVPNLAIETIRLLTLTHQQKHCRC